MDKFVIMKSLTLLIICCLLADTNALSFVNKLLFQRRMHLMGKRLDFPDLWIEQRLDNFHPADKRSWMQRYFMSHSFSKPGGPVFLQIGGEGPADPVWMREGHWITMAKQFRAACFMIEHRYYGKSHPTSDVSNENLSFLSSEQALADIANFITNTTIQYKLHGRKWIVFGGSYSGALAIWARLKYPHLVAGAVSASAPLNALVDFKNYLEVCAHALTSYGSSTCVANLAAASRVVASNLKTSDGRKYLHSLFNLCDPLQPGSYDEENFQEDLAGNVMGVVQYNKDNRAFEGAIGTDITIETVCGIMDNSSIGEPIQRYAHLNQLTLEVYEQKCLDSSYAKYLQDMRQSSWEVVTGARQWVYQTCTEFGWYQTSDSNHQPFQGFPLKFTLDTCSSLYELDHAEVSDGVQRSNEFYGSLLVADVVTNVTLYNGGVDPWSNVSYVHKQKPDILRYRRDVIAMQKSDATSGIYTVFVPETAHCAIMYPSHSDDPPLLKEARMQVEKQVAQWLGVSK